MDDPLIIDGSHGEGGGQILRTALSISAVTRRPIRIEHIRAGRPKPGLAAQHLTAVRALGALCDAHIDGAALGSQALSFAPGVPPRARHYEIDVAQAREGGSAGAVTLVLQAMLLPLAFAEGRSTVDLRGGTHAAHSPPFEAIHDAWLPLVREMGIEADAQMLARGWYPVGRGHVRATIDGRPGRHIAALRRLDRGDLLRVSGRAVTSGLPAHIAQRMVQRAHASLAEAGISSDLETHDAPAACPGAGLFLTAEYTGARSTFGGLGARGKPAEVVADEAVKALLAFHASGASLDVYLGDQALLPAALAGEPSAFTAERASEHLRTNAWVIEQFGIAHVQIAAPDGAPAVVRVVPEAAARPRQ